MVFKKTSGMTLIHAVFNHSLPDFTLDVSLALPASGVTAVFGRSGSGKTTLLRAIAGLERVAGGYLAVRADVWQDAARGIFRPVHQRPLGYVFQDANLLAHLSVAGNLDFGLRRTPPALRRLPLDQAIALLGIEKLLPRRVSSLSGGERQRVAIARALATSPQLLLMDEPLASLDIERKAEVLPYLERLAHELRIPMLYVSHALDEVARLADHLVLLDTGCVLATGPAAELLSRLDLPLAHGDAAAAIIDAVVTRLEPDYHLSHAEFAGGQISLINRSLHLGQRVRVRVQARDVSLSLQRQSGSSVLNVFAASVTHLSPDSPGQVMVGLSAGGSTLLARISLKSADTLQLQVGLPVFAQVKGVAVLG